MQERELTPTAQIANATRSFRPDRGRLRCATRRSGGFDLPGVHSSKLTQPAQTASRNTLRGKRAHEYQK